MKPVLIALVSPKGSTREIVGHIQKAFRVAGRSVQVAELVPGASGPVVDLDRFGAVVVAAPIHGMKWMPEAVDWVASHRAALAQVPVALVSVAYVYFEGRLAWRRAIEQSLEAVRATLPRAEVQFFGGRLAAPLPLPARWLFGIRTRRLDLVEPAAVEAWAEAWAQTLG